jgi:hypothetical protein
VLPDLFAPVGNLIFSFNIIIAIVASINSIELHASDSQHSSICTYNLSNFSHKFISLDRPALFMMIVERSMGGRGRDGLEGGRGNGMG